MKKGKIQMDPKEMILEHIKELNRQIYNSKRNSWNSVTIELMKAKSTALLALSACKD
jgi:hypothetical protein